MGKPLMGEKQIFGFGRRRRLRLADQFVDGRTERESTRMGVITGKGMGFAVQCDRGSHVLILHQHNKLMQFMIIDAECEIWQLGSILFRFFAIFFYPSLSSPATIPSKSIPCRRAISS